MRKDIYGMIIAYGLLSLFVGGIAPLGFNAEEQTAIRWFMIVLPVFVLYAYALMVKEKELVYSGRKVSLRDVFYWMVEAALGQWIADKLWRVGHQ